MNSNVLWFLLSWYDLNFVCVLVNHSRTHKYQELSKSINPLITIGAFNDFLIQSQNHCLHKMCSCHICSCIFLHTNVLQHFEPYEGCLFISFKNYLKHINEKSFVLINKMILSLKSKRIFLCILVHHCMQPMTLNILVYPWNNPLLFLDIFRVNVHDYYELHSYEHSDLYSYEHSELWTSYL